MLALLTEQYPRAGAADRLPARGARGLRRQPAPDRAHGAGGRAGAGRRRAARLGRAAGAAPRAAGAATRPSPCARSRSARYEAGRPPAEQACRVGDERFLPRCGARSHVHRHPHAGDTHRARPRAGCSGRGEPRRVRTALVGERRAGDWLLVFLDSAREAHRRAARGRGQCAARPGRGRLRAALRPAPTPPSSCLRRWTPPRWPRCAGQLRRLATSSTRHRHDRRPHLPAARSRASSTERSARSCVDADHARRLRSPAPGDRVLFFSGDPVQFPEGAGRRGGAARAARRSVAGRFGIGVVRARERGGGRAPLRLAALADAGVPARRPLRHHAGRHARLD